MATLYALLVGVDAYLPPVRALRGCRADVLDAARFLSDAASPEMAVRLEVLLDEEATREGVIAAFRRHLGQAGEDDAALFWFSGHGSTAPLPDELWHTEAQGRRQTLLCVDSRHGAPDLYDKELAGLIREVAGRGAHAAVVLDCCHAESGTREGVAGLAGVGRRWHEDLDVPPPVDALLPELRDGAALAPGGPHHVELAACRASESAHEAPVLEGKVRGVFSLGLLKALRRLGATATYREAMTAARCYVENQLDGQVPRLHPISEIVDRPFLGGQLRPPVASMVMRCVHDTWEIDAGLCHGLVAPPAGEAGALRVGVAKVSPAREARVVEIFSERSTVEPIGWTPDKRQEYPVVLTSVPLPPTRVAIRTLPDDDPHMAALVAGALATAGPAGGPSPHVAVVDPADPGQAPELKLATPADGTVRILGAGGKLLASVDGRPGRPNAAAAVADLEHIARWRQIRDLTNPLSRLAGKVRLEVVEALPGEPSVPRHRPALPTGDDGILRLSYAHGPAGWTPPAVFMRLHNAGATGLYCALLDLTDRFRIHPDLFPGTFIAPDVTVGANDGEPIEFTLPPGRGARPGVFVEDWLLLIVAETEFSSTPFVLPRLGEPVADHARSGNGIAGVLERLGMVAAYRDAVPKSSSAYDWTTSILQVETSVPGQRPQ